MARIVAKSVLAPKTHYFRIQAPLIARHAKPGQFIILRINELSERIPLTIADINPNEGSITLVVQEIGKTTQQMALLQEGDDIRDILGPLGSPSEIEHFGTVVLLGGGFGIAAIHLLAKHLFQKKNKIISIIGARTKELLIMEEQMRRISDYMIIKTDDGSAGSKGLVTEPLQELLRDKGSIDRVIAVGPIPMMRAVAEMTRPYNVKTIISLNPIMIDGTGMCGGCRVHIGDKTMFACTDGPEFDAHQVDFKELVNRTQMYRDYEKCAVDSCRMEKQIAEISSQPMGVQP